ncbi:hypothetical protein BASA81_000549 [Batrachochytrium salamandrivorans]|nr:hypothetical protein BASA81_000549 [Batrachochytrium salamandrivorans]
MSAPMLASESLSARLQQMFETSSLLLSSNQDLLAGLEEFKTLEQLGLPKRVKLDTKPITLRNFVQFESLCRRLVDAMHAPRVLMEDQAYQKLGAKHFKSIGKDLDDAIATGKLELVGKDLQLVKKMLLVQQFLYRSGSRVFSIHLASSLGFDSSNKPVSMLIPRALMDHAQSLGSININNTKANKTCAAAFAYLALRADGLVAMDSSRCSVMDTGAAIWGLVLQQSTCRLTKLTLRKAKIGDLGAMALAIGLSKARTLEFLSLEGNLIRSKGVQHLGRALLQNPVLRELNLNENRAGSSGGCAVASFLLHPNCKLEILHLEKNDIGPRGGKAISVAVSRNTCLLELYLGRNDLEDDGAAPFGTCLEFNQTLRILDLSDCDISNVGLAGIGLGLRVNSSLQHLICPEQLIADAGCCALAASLAMNPYSGLLTLDLRMNMIRNAGAEALAMWLEIPSCKLEQLCLGDNDVMDQGARRFGQCLLTNATYSKLKVLDLSGNPMAAKAFNSSLRPINQQTNRFTRVLVMADGARITRRNIRAFGAMITRYRMDGMYYSVLLVFTIFSQWLDLGLDVYVCYNQVVLALHTMFTYDFVYAALLGVFVALPYLYTVVFFRLPEDASKYNQRGCCSSYSVAKLQLLGINLLQLRLAYEIYLSLRSELTTLSYASIRLVQCVLGAMPQSLIQLHILLSSANLLVIERKGLTGEWRILSMLLSLCFSFGMISSTVCFIYEEKFVTNWKKVDFRFEFITYVLGMTVAFGYHLCHYVFRALFLVLVACFYGPVLGCGLVLLGLAARWVLWYCFGSQRRKLFIVVSYLVGIASWDKRTIARVAHLIELVEAGLVIAPFWVPTEYIVQIPDTGEFYLGFQKQQWLDLIRVVGPIPLSCVVGGGWAVSTYLYFAFVEQLHPYTDVDERCNMDRAAAMAQQPFSAHAIMVLEKRRDGNGRPAAFRVPAGNTINQTNEVLDAQEELETNTALERSRTRQLHTHLGIRSSTSQEMDWDLFSKLPAPTRPKEPGSPVTPTPPTPPSSAQLPPLSISRSSTLPPTPSTSTPTPTQQQAERILIRLDPPVEGIESQSISYLRQADGGQVYANRRLEYTWLRSKVQRTCEESSCPRQREAATIQDLVTGRRYCSKQCMLLGFRATTARMLLDQTNSATALQAGASRRLGSQAEAAIDYDAGDHLVWDAKPFVEDTEWVEVCKMKNYVPTSQDVGHVLKCVISAFGQDSANPTVTASSDETPVVIGPPPPPPKRRLVQCHPQQLQPQFQDPNNFQFRVVTYNILADIYATTQIFPYCPKWAMNWRYRRVQIMREIVSYDADIICLQEVQQDHYQQYLLPLLENLGYEGLYKAKTRDNSVSGKVDGCATLFRRSRFSLCQNSYYEIEFNKAAHKMASQGAFVKNSPSSGRGGGAQLAPPNDAATQACLKRLCKDNVAHVAILQGVNPNTGEISQICIANTHMYWDPEYPDVKLWQAHYLLQELEGIAGNRMLPLVLCGDFNSTPTSAVVEFLAQERVKPEHDDLTFDKVGILPDVGQLTHTLGLASAVGLISGGEPMLTNFTASFQNTLDYVWLNEFLTGVSMLEMPTEQDLRQVEDEYMPNSVFPSDHIAICVDLRLADSSASSSNSSSAAHHHHHHHHGQQQQDGDFY